MQVALFSCLGRLPGPQPRDDERYMQEENRMTRGYRGTIVNVQILPERHCGFIV